MLSPDAGRNSIVPAEPNSKAANTAYATFSIISPIGNELVHKSDGDIDVALDLEPALNIEAGHLIVVLMDGKRVAEGAELNYDLPNLEPGTHRLQAEIRDQSDRRVAATPTVSFSL